MAIAIGDLDDMLFFPYDSEGEIGFEDRLYNSQVWADYFKQFIGNGVFPNPSNGLKVESLHNSMALTLRVGAAFADGRLYMQKKDFIFSVTPAHLTLGRRDIVICRHDAINRTMQALYIEGTPSSLPVVPSIVRTDDIFDLKLCEITVNPNAQTITQANILDTRLNSEVCGIVHGLIDQVDTTDIFNQYQTFLNEQIPIWNAVLENQQNVWGEWFGAAVADPANFFQRNFDNPAMYIGSTKWSIRIDSNTQLEEIRAGQLMNGSIAASRTSIRRQNGADIEYTFYDLQNSSIITRFVEHHDRIDSRTTRNRVEGVI